MADDHSGGRLGSAPDDTRRPQATEMNLAEFLRLCEVESTADWGLPPLPQHPSFRDPVSSRTVSYSTDSYGTTARSSWPSEAGDKGKQVHGRQPLLKSPSRLPVLRKRLNFLEDHVRALVFAELLREATDIQSPCPQLADRLPNLLETFAHRQLGIQSQENLNPKEELPWFVLEHRELVHARAPE
jgi:hypothetical protein